MRARGVRVAGRLRSQGRTRVRRRTGDRGRARRVADPGGIAVVGTNVGSYLVVALGASSASPDNAKKFALTVFQALSSAAA